MSKKKLGPLIFRTSKKISLLFICPSLILQASFAGDLPTGGVVVGGSGTITQNTDNMVINQASQNMVVNWNSFSIGQNKTVEFIQPNQNAAALNQVMGHDPSVIQGMLKSNGKVFLVNPNGVIFSPTAQVDVGGLVASALQISIEDFMAGNYNFEGESESAIINQGNIHAANGGTIAFIAAKITNDGSLNAEGGDILLGAGNKVTLDLGGPVKLHVDQAAIDALIVNGGIIKADGGSIYITAKAAGDLSTTVINNTGVIEAQTLATGKNGEIYLLGDMVNDKIVVAGKLDASAPHGGDGGFIETSASKVSVQDSAQITTHSNNGNSGTWLIDPTDYTIASSGGDITGATLATNLGSGNVVITTSGAGGNVNVNDSVSWNANKLTLTAHNNIAVNANLTATGTGSLFFKYGQDSANGGNSTYTVASAAKVLIPTASSFTWQKGSAGVVNNLVYNNNLLRFGNGTEAALNSTGSLLQPFYYDDGTTSSRSAGYYKLTYSNYPLDIGIATGGDGTNSWNYNGTKLITNGGGYNPTSTSFDISGYQEGIGTIISSVILSISGSDMQVENKYQLDAGAAFIKTVTTLKNIDSSATQGNVRLWVGTRDDYVADSDVNYKLKGNIGGLGGGFDPITAQNQRANAVKISESDDGVTGAAVLFYSLSTTADISTDRCCSFTNVTNKDPRASDILIHNDGSYALFQRFENLGAGQSDSMTWYYAAAPAARINSVVTNVAAAAAATTAPPVIVTQPAPPVVVASAPVVLPARGEIVPQQIEQTHFNNRNSLGSVNFVLPTSTPNLIIDGLEFVNINPVSFRAPASSGPSSATFRSIGSQSNKNEASTTTVAAPVESDSSIIMNVQNAAKDTNIDLMQVFVYDGGITTPLERE